MNFFCMSLNEARQSIDVSLSIRHTPFLKCRSLKCRRRNAKLHLKRHGTCQCAAAWHMSMWNGEAAWLMSIWRKALHMWMCNCEAAWDMLIWRKALHVSMWNCGAVWHVSSSRFQMPMRRSHMSQRLVDMWQDSLVCDMTRWYGTWLVGMGHDLVVYATIHWQSTHKHTNTQTH